MVEVFLVDIRWGPIEPSAPKGEGLSTDAARLKTCPDTKHVHRFASYLRASVVEHLQRSVFVKWPRSSKFVRLRIIRIGIIVKAFAGFAPVPASHHQPLQQWRRSKAALFEFVVHHVGDVVSRVEADEIEQRERAHGIAAA